MPSLQLGLTWFLIFVVSSLDGDEKLISVAQLSTDVNNFCCTTWESRPCCRVAKCKGRHCHLQAGWTRSWSRSSWTWSTSPWTTWRRSRSLGEHWGPWLERPWSRLGIHHLAPDFPHDVGWTSTKSPTPRTRSSHHWFVSISLGPPPGMPLAVLALSSAVRWHLASLAWAPWHQGWSPVLADVARKHRLQILVPLWSSEQQREDGPPLVVSRVHLWNPSVIRVVFQVRNVHINSARGRELARVEM